MSLMMIQMILINLEAYLIFMPATLMALSKNGTYSHLIALYKLRKSKQMRAKNVSFGNLLK